jgi:hypothetical protein
MLPSLVSFVRIRYFGLSMNAWHDECSTTYSGEESHQFERGHKLLNTGKQPTAHRTRRKLMLRPFGSSGFLNQCRRPAAVNGARLSYNQALRALLFAGAHAVDPFLILCQEVAVRGGRIRIAKGPEQN